MLVDDPLWYRNAIIYQVHIRAFADSNGDGIGDFPGLASRLDYLRDLGVTTVWVLPFYPSPLRDDGYDIADYTAVHPDYGTLADFRHFIREAHRRGLKVITELVLNHTSEQHPWFQRARRAPAGSKWRDFYVWSDSPEKYKEARIIFKDFEASNWTWDPVARAYYWHRFYHHQPDLNYENPEVWRAMLKALDFWLGLGVDGLRLDAVPYLFEKEGTNCENLPQTHEALKALRRHVDERYPNRMLLAEANQWPEDAAAYFGDGDECHMAFHFPVMPRIFMAVRMEDRYPLVDILTQTPRIPDNCQWAVFLRNHDELTLEMVTDEERDYMYRVYASDPRARINLGIRRRLAPLLGNDRRRIELMNALLFSLTGTPVIYYGDEIGMGDNIYLGDRNGVRTPMQWSGDRNAGFSRANAQRLYLPVIIDPDFHYEAVNAETQLNNQHSLLWWTRRLIGLRRRHSAFGQGEIEFLFPENRKVLTFVRSHGEEKILVVANLSRYVQHVELDLTAFQGLRPVEMFGRSDFPVIRESPYLLTLGPHGFYWFTLEPAIEAIELTTPAWTAPTVRTEADWPDLLLTTGPRREIEEVLAPYLSRQRWFGGKARRIKSTAITEIVPLGAGDGCCALAFVQVDYVEHEPETYLLPLSLMAPPPAESEEQPDIVVRIHSKRGERLLVGALGEKRFADLLLAAIGQRRRFKGSHGEITAVPEKGWRQLKASAPALEPALLRAEQSNSSILYGDRLLLKMFRRLDEGTNPDLEITRFLRQRARFAHVPAVWGNIEYRRPSRPPITLAILSEFVTNEGDAWRYTLDSLGRYFERAATRLHDAAELPLPDRPLTAGAVDELPAAVPEHIGSYLEMARLLGQRTAEMHAALASDQEDPAFAPEPFNPFYQRSLYQSMRNQATASLELLKKRLDRLPDSLHADARKTISKERDIMGRFGAVLSGTITALRTRVHGDYHLGQVLFTGRDFIIIDFEGEPAHTLTARRIKRSPLRDVAGMLRSFHYASFSALFDHLEHGSIAQEDHAVAEVWARSWTAWVSATFLSAYLTAAKHGGFLPQEDRELRALLDAYLLEKATYELSYELNNRPEWVRIPIRGILDLLEAE